MNSKKIVLGAAAALFLLALPVSVAGAEQPSAGTYQQTVYMNFSDAQQTHAFDVQAAQGAGVLSVSVQDCCIPGDIWVAFAAHGQPGGEDSATARGDGNTVVTSEPVSVNGWSKGTVTISYDEGVDSFPAGMSVTFTYSTAGSGEAQGNTGMVITPLD